MGFDEAVALLGLTPPFTAKDVRRAYLRLLKVHKPETDPDGFMRLRQAYEMFDGVESVGPRDDRAAPEREASDSEPERPLAEASDEPEATGELDQRATDLDEALLAPWQREVPEDPKVAAVVLTEWLERAKSDPTAPSPPMTAALRLLWSMLDRRAFKTAGHLYRALDEWLVQVGSARGELAWGLTQGLWAMRKDIPEELYSPIVRAVASENPGVAADALRSYAHEAPGLAEALQRRMAARSPELAAVFSAYLMPPVEERLAPASATRPWYTYGWAAVVVGMAVLRAFTGSSSSSSGSPQQPMNRHALLRQMAASRANELASAADGAGWAELSGHARTLSIAVANEMCVKAHEELAICQALVAASDTHRATFIPMIQQVESPILEHCGKPPAKPPAPVLSASTPSSASVSAPATVK